MQPSLWKSKLSQDSLVFNVQTCNLETLLRLRFWFTSSGVGLGFFILGSWVMPVLLVFGLYSEEQGSALESSSSLQTVFWVSCLLHIWTQIESTFQNQFKNSYFLFIVEKKERFYDTSSAFPHRPVLKSNCHWEGGAGGSPREALKCLLLHLFMNRINVSFVPKDADPRTTHKGMSTCSAKTRKAKANSSMWKVRGEKKNSLRREEELFKT